MDKSIKDLIKELNEIPDEEFAKCETVDWFSNLSEEKKKNIAREVLIGDDNGINVWRKGKKVEIYNKAKEIGGKIQLIVQGDYNDSDYSYAINAFTPVKFLELQVYKAYLIFKGAMENQLPLDEITEKYLYCGRRPSAEEIEEPKYVDYITNYNAIGDWEPVGETASGDAIHTITDVKLQIIVDV